MSKEQQDQDISPLYRENCCRWRLARKPECSIPNAALSCFGMVMWTRDFIWVKNSINLCIICISHQICPWIYEGIVELILEHRDRKRHRCWDMFLPSALMERSCIFVHVFTVGDSLWNGWYYGTICVLHEIAKYAFEDESQTNVQVVSLI